ncbi:MAG: hypothetical protein JWM11_7939 [Planctomycetaceae bacterium]|nr:hypothetical protein [Planctomycetaceae bacterium]
MMLDDDVVAVSPASVFRVLKRAGRLDQIRSTLQSDPPPFRHWLHHSGRQTGRNRTGDLQRMRPEAGTGTRATQACQNRPTQDCLTSQHLPQWKVTWAEDTAMQRCNRSTGPGAKSGVETKIHLLVSLLQNSISQHNSGIGTKALNLRGTMPRSD